MELKKKCRSVPTVFFFLVSIFLFSGKNQFENFALKNRIKVKPDKSKT